MVFEIKKIYKNKHRTKNFKVDIIGRTNLKIQIIIGIFYVNSFMRM